MGCAPNPSNVACHHYNHIRVNKIRQQDVEEAMLLSPVFERFVERTPFAVMARSLLERALPPEAVDALFEDKADKQYTRELTFSSVVDLVGQVVTAAFPSVRAAYLDKSFDVPVSLTAPYNKLQRIEPQGVFRFYTLRGQEWHIFKALERV